MPGILSSLMQAKRESFFLFSGCGGGWIHLHIQRSFKKPPLSLPHCVVCGGLGEPSKGGANGFTAGILSSPPSTLGANALRIVCPESFFPRILELSDPPLERSFSGRKDFTLFPFPMCGTTRKKMFRGRCNFPVCALLPYSLLLIVPCCGFSFFGGNILAAFCVREIGLSRLWKRFFRPI